MQEISREIPNPEVLIRLEPEELGAKLLFLLRRRSLSREMFQPPALTAELWQIPHFPGQQTPYPQQLKQAIDIAMAEAWAWLEAQGLIVPAPDQNAPYGWKILSRRAKKFENEQQFARYTIARMLPKDALHPRLSNEVWMAFMRGEYGVSVFQAMKAVEVSVRKASGLSEKIGVPLMRSAFSPKDGILTDLSADSGEQIARMELFAGAIGSYKNPHSHRDVDLDDPVEAIETIMLANHLLKIVDARAEANRGSNEEAR